MAETPREEFQGGRHWQCREDKNFWGGFTSFRKWDVGDLSHNHSSGVIRLNESEGHDYKLFLWRAQKGNNYKGKGMFLSLQYCKNPRKIQTPEKVFKKRRVWIIVESISGRKRRGRFKSTDGEISLEGNRERPFLRVEKGGEVECSCRVCLQINLLHIHWLNPLKTNRTNFFSMSEN